MLGPPVRGETVRLAPPPPDFAEIVLPWFEDPVIQRYVIPNPLSLQEEREFLERVARDPTLVFWAIWAGDEPIGTTAITGIDWRHRHGETGSMIGPAACRGRGFGTAAHRLRSRYAFAELGLETLLTFARADNVASIRALQKVGYREIGIARRVTFSEGQWHDRWLAQLLREDWERATGGGNA